MGTRVAEATGKTMVAERAEPSWTVRHPFQFAGVSYFPGDTFTHTDPRQIRKLRSAGHLWDQLEVPHARN